MLVKKSSLLLYAFLFFSTGAFCQHLLSGYVVSGNDGIPVKAATVLLSQSKTNTLTDSAGGFTIEVNGPDTLVIACIGYAVKRIPLAPKVKQIGKVYLMPVSGTLKDIAVNTGYQQLPKERATGSFAQVDNRLLDRVVSENILSRLDGVAPGLVFNKSPRSDNTPTDINIRGISSINSSTQPLIVLDNFPYEGDINNINPNDIENITILKDAAAASIWGTKAGNGVIVITTKKAHYDRKTILTLNSNVSITDKPDLFYIPEFSSGDFIDVEKFLFGRGFYDNSLNNTTSWPVVSPVVELLNKARAGQIAQNEADSQIGQYRSLSLLDDENKYLYRKSVSQQYSVSLSAGSNTLNYLFSAGYDKQLDNQVGNGNNRLTLRLLNNIKPLKNVEITLGAIYTQNNSDNNSELNDLMPGGGKNTYYPYAQLADKNGNPLPLEKDYRSVFIDTAGQGKLLVWKYYPLSEQKLNDNTGKANDILLNLGITYHLYKDLDAEVKYQYEHSDIVQRNDHQPESYYVRNLINLYTPTGGTAMDNSAIPYGGILDLTDSYLSSHDIRGQLNYHKNWKGIHDLSVIAGGEISQVETNLNAYRTYGYDKNVLSVRYVNYVDYFPSYDAVQGNYLLVPSGQQFTDLTNRMVSVFMNGAYSLFNRYTLSASARRDASNIFGVATNHKWKPLWSVGGSWEISKESFYHFTALPYIRIRVTHGYSGNVNNTQPALLTLNNIGNNLYNLPESMVNNPPNPDLRWEQVSMDNIGIDFSLKNDRIGGSVEGYIKKSSDLIASSPADPTTGYQYLTRNTADLKSKGIDIGLHSLNIAGVFRWQMAFNLSYNINRVAKYLIKPATAFAYIGNGSIINPIQGQLAYSIISYKWAGLDPQTGDPRGYVDGQVSNDYSKIENSGSMDGLVIEGSARPLFYGNTLNTFSWKNFSLSFNLVYRFKYFYRRPNTLSYSGLFNSWALKGYADYLVRWQYPGDELKTNVPSMVYPANSARDDFYENSEVTVEKGDNIRLQDIRLDYNIPAKWLKLKTIKQLSAYCYAGNLGIVWKKSKYKMDPDYGTPPPKQFSFGINATF